MRSGQPRLDLEARHRVRVLGVLRGDDLQRHRAVEVRIGGLVDHSHPAAIELALDPIPRKQRPALQTGHTIGVSHDAAPPYGHAQPLGRGGP